MQKNDEMILKQLINEAEVVSFDVFDTLLFRKVDTPETIFDIVGRCFHIHGFRKLRVDCQNEASRRTYALNRYPHADMDEIYEVLSEHTEIPVDWQQVKEFEIQIEKDSLVCNPEMLEVYQYAKRLGKRVIATSDMYLFAKTLSEILEAAGYTDFDYIYCSADERKAKFNKELFSHVAEREAVPFKKILHIGDSRSADVEIPGSFGIKTFLYERTYPSENQIAPSSGIDMGLIKILYNHRRSFWYNLGITAGGPLYMGLYQWLAKICRTTEKKIFFLSRDGYNIYKLLKESGFENVEYLYMSRRSMVLAGITEMDEESIRELPPYTLGQTVEEILNYLGVSKEKILHLQEAGFTDFNDKITTTRELANFKKLFTRNKDVFLPICEKERASAIAYFQKTGFLKENCLVFDCGWNGSSQHLLERFKKAICSEVETPFLYFGIRNTEKSRRQLHGQKYETYAFDFYKNYSLQQAVDSGIAVFELFFTAPHESVYYYDKGTPILEAGNGNEEQADLLAGIRDYLTCALPFSEKYAAGVEYTPDIAVGHLRRLVISPTEEEAVQIGNLSNVDGFARERGEEKKIAFLTERQYKANNHAEVYWLQGFLKRPDISEKLKTIIAKREGSKYPPTPSAEYHLEDGMSIRNYYRWLRWQEEQSPIEQLSYRPMFSVLIPVYNTVSSQLEEAFDSVLAQTYDNYELILVDDASTWQNVVPVLKEYEANEHVTVIYRHQNGHISEATNDAIAASAGDYIVFMDCDDTLEPNALYEFADLLNKNPVLDFIYSDEDKITEDGKIRHMPFFKPDWSPDLFMSLMYTNHLAAYRASITKEIGGLRSAYNGSQDYDFTLRFMEKSDNTKVGHISKILYHWRERKESIAFAMSSKNYASEAARYAKEAAILRRGLKAHLECIPEMSQYRIVYDVPTEPLVSIIIPSKDHPELLKQCIDSIHTYTTYQNYEILVIDNGSSPENHEVVSEYLSDIHASYYHDEYSFNFSKMCNIGAGLAEGEYLLFLNDDIEIFQPDWLTRMMGQAMQPHTGAVGAKLFYPESTEIQHAGVFNHFKGPSHMFHHQNDCCPNYFGLNHLDYDAIAVTGACLLLKKRLFVLVGGFDETLPVSYNDVDLCFSLYEAGYYNVVRNDVSAYHHESASRGIDCFDEEKSFRLSAERQTLFLKHPELYRKDPFLNENLEAYCPTLTPKQRFDPVSVSRLKRKITDVRFVPVPVLRLKRKISDMRFMIDQMSITDRICVVGWAFLPMHKDNDELICNVLFLDSNGILFRARAGKYPRPDVSSAFRREDLLNSGFECVIDRGILRPELMEYHIGVEIIDKKGKTHVGWQEKPLPVTEIPKTYPSYADPVRAEELPSVQNTGDVKWHIDSIEEDSRGISIKGWAFFMREAHYLYKTQIILSDGEKESIVFPCCEIDNPEVSHAYPEIRFLRYSGFRCDILKKVLAPEVGYTLFLRFADRVDGKVECDIDTGKMIVVTGN